MVTFSCKRSWEADYLDLPSIVRVTREKEKRLTTQLANQWICHRILHLGHAMAFKGYITEVCPGQYTFTHAISWNWDPQFYSYTSHICLTKPSVYSGIKLLEAIWQHISRAIKVFINFDPVFPLLRIYLFQGNIQKGKKENYMFITVLEIRNNQKIQQ